MQKTTRIDFKRSPAAHHTPLKNNQKISMQKWKPLIILGIILTALAFLIAQITSSRSTATHPIDHADAAQIKTVTIPLPPIPDPESPKSSPQTGNPAAS